MLDKPNRLPRPPEQAPDGFLSRVSYELRTPLTLILAPLESLLGGEHGELAEGQRGLAETAHRNTVRLLEVITGLLDTSRPDANEPLPAGAAAPASSPAVAGPDDERPCVLAAVDSGELGDYVAGLLHEVCHTWLARDGEEALRLIRQEKPQLVLAEVTLPGRDGLSLCKEVKADPETAGIPVVLLTALTQREALRKGWEAGADEYLFKPFHPRELVTRVRTLLSATLERRRAHEELRQRRRAQEALQELAGTLERRVAERTAELEQQARELREMNRALMLSNQELDDFAYIASHDLKEPLRGLANYSRFLLEDYGDQFDEDGRHKLETLGHLSRRMSDLIDSLHQYSRLGRVELAVVPTDLNEVLAGVLDGLRITLEEKRVEVRRPRPLPTVACDRVRVGEIFHNLITNAVKYNDKPHKWVEVGSELSARPGGPEVFYVRDNGIGIRERHLQAIFKMFKRLHGREQYGGGTGVGLTIARRIVERHGGRIWAVSVHGQGTTFSFTLAPEGGADGGTA
jgi:signal transduction histidine kinase